MAIQAPITLKSAFECLSGFLIYLEISLFFWRRFKISYSQSMASTHFSNFLFTKLVYFLSFFFYVVHYIWFFFWLSRFIYFVYFNNFANFFYFVVCLFHFIYYIFFNCYKSCISFLRIPCDHTQQQLFNLFKFNI